MALTKTYYVKVLIPKYEIIESINAKDAVKHFAKKGWIVLATSEKPFEEESRSEQDHL
jgi:hypothetical protein